LQKKQLDELVAVAAAAVAAVVVVVVVVVGRDVSPPCKCRGTA